MQIRRAKIASTGMFVPSRKVTNEYFNELYKQDVDKFLREKRNIKSRYFMDPDQATSDLIVPAAQQAMERARVKPEDIDLIIVATDTPDYLSPSTAAVVHKKLKTTNAGCFDINAACAGFVTALDTASKFITADSRYKNILIIGAYGMTKFLDFDDYKIATLFADGAGAAVIQPTTNENEGVLASYLWADGNYYDAMGIYAGGTKEPVNEFTLKTRMNLLKFLKKIPPEFNAIHWPRIARLLLEQIGATPADVKRYFLTQINIDSIRETMQRLEVPEDRSHNIMDRYGYTGSACLPMAMNDAVTRGALRKGDLVLMIGSGGGVSMGGVALRWSYDS